LECACRHALTFNLAGGAADAGAASSVAAGIYSTSLPQPRMNLISKAEY